MAYLRGCITFQVSAQIKCTWRASSTIGGNQEAVESTPELLRLAATNIVAVYSSLNNNACSY